MINKLINNIKSRSAKKNSDTVDAISYPPDFSDREIKIIEWIKPYTMTSSERIVSLIRAIDYLVLNEVRGDFVECGVWRGGNMMIAARMLMEYGIKDRKLYLYDTFEGMTEPSEQVDFSYEGDSAKELLISHTKTKEDVIWAYSPIDEVKNNLYSIGYPDYNIIFVQGKVEDTIPGILPDKIALLRLDTDWYESTYHEFEHLFPILTINGVLIIDDYGHWKGAQKATDDYIKKYKLKLFLNRMDYTGRLAIKV